MWQSYCNTILSSLLGEYVEEYDKDSLKVSVWNGNVLISNLKCKLEMWNSLLQEFPIVLKNGSIGEMELKVNWKNIAQIDIIIKRVHVKVAMTAKVGIQKVKEEVENRMERLVAKRLRIQTEEKWKQNSSSWKYRVLVKMLDCIQVKVEKVHVELEDDGISNPHIYYKAGVVVETFTLQSTEVKWCLDSAAINGKDAKLIQEKCIRKGLELKGLQVYWDCNTEGENNFIIHPMSFKMHFLLNESGVSIPLSNQEFECRTMEKLGTTWLCQVMELMTKDRWMAFVEGVPALANGKKYTIRFVFCAAWEVAVEHTEEFEEEQKDAYSAVGRKIPSLKEYGNAVASILQWSYKETKQLMPVIEAFHGAAICVLQEKSAYMELMTNASEIELNLSQKQYHSILSTIAHISSFKTTVMIHRLRPKNAVLQSPKEWWKFAMQAIVVKMKTLQGKSIDPTEKKVDWNAALVKIKQRKLYVQEFINAQKNGTTSVLLDQLEDELPIPDIILYRQLAMKMCPKNRSSRGKSMLSYSYWFQSSEDELSKSIDALEFNQIIKPEKEAIVRFRVHAAVELISLRLTNNYKSIAHAVVRGGVIQCTKRSLPSFEVDITVADFNLDASDQLEKNTYHPVAYQLSIAEASVLHPNLIMPATILKDCEQPLPLVHFNVQIPPEQALNCKAVQPDIRIILISQPFQFNIFVPLLMPMLNFFSRPSYLDFRILDNLAIEHAVAFSTYSASQIREAVSQRNKIHLDIDAIAPVIQVFDKIDGYYPDATNIDVNRFTLYLGQLQGTSALQPNYEKALAIGEARHDILKLAVSGVMMTISRQGMHDDCTILQQCNLNFAIHSSIAPDDKTIPWIKLMGEIEKLSIDISMESLQQGLALLSFISSSISNFSDNVECGNTAFLNKGNLDSDDFVRVRRQSSFSDSFNAALSRSSEGDFPLLQDLKEELSESTQCTPSEAVLIWNREMLYACFKITHVNITIFDPETEIEQPLVKVLVDNISFKYAQYTYDKTFGFRLGCFNILDYAWHRDAALPSSKKCRLMSSVTSEKYETMIEVDIGMASSDIPVNYWASLNDSNFDEIMTDRKVPIKRINLGLQYAIQITMNSLQMEVHQETIAKFIEYYIYGSINSAHAVIKSPTPSFTRSISNSSLSFRDLPIASTSWNMGSFPTFQTDGLESRPANLQNVQGIDFNFRAKFVQLVLADRHLGDVASCRLRELIFSVRKLRDDVKVSSKIHSVLVLDLTAPCDLRIVFSQASEDALDPFWVAEYNSEEVAINTGNGSIDLALTSSKLRIATSFLRNLQNLLLLGPLYQCLNTASEKEVRSLEIAIQEDYQSILPLLKIRIQSIELDIPCTSIAQDCIQLRVHSINVDNEHHNPSSIKAEVNRIEVSLLQNIDQVMQASVLVQRFDMGLTGIDGMTRIVNITFTPLKLAIAKRQYLFVQNVVMSNIVEECSVIPVFTPTHSQSPQARDNGNLEIKCNLSYFEIEFCDEVKNCELVPFATWKMEDLKLCSRLEDDVIECNIELYSFCLYCDSTHVKPKYKKVFASTYGESSETSILCISVLKNSTSGDSDIDLTLPLISFLPCDAVLSTIELITATPPSTVQVDAAVSTTVNNFRFSIQIDEIAVILIQDNASQRSKSIVWTFYTRLQYESSASGSQLELNIRKFNIQSLLQNSNGLQTATPEQSAITSAPFDIFCDVVVDRIGNTTGKLSIKPKIALQIGFLDVRIIRDALQFLSHRSSDKEQNESLASMQVSPNEKMVYSTTKFRLTSLISSADIEAVVELQEDGYLVRREALPVKSNGKRIDFKFFPIIVPGVARRFNRKMVYDGDFVNLGTSPTSLIRKCSTSGRYVADGKGTPFVFRIWKIETILGKENRLESSAIYMGDTIVLDSMSVRTAGSAKDWFMGDGTGDTPVPLTIKPVESNTMSKSVSSIASVNVKNVAIDVRGIMVTIFDDLNMTKVPIMHVELIDVDSVCGHHDSKTTVLLSGDIRTSFYNSYLNVWEPLVESWKFGLAVHMNGGVICATCAQSSNKLKCPFRSHPCPISGLQLIPFAFSSSHMADLKRKIRRDLLRQSQQRLEDRSNSVLLVSENILNINVSHALIRFVANLGQLLSENDKSHSSSVMGCSVFIDNQSGVDFYYREASNIDHEESNEWIIIEQNSVVKTSILPHDPPTSRITGRQKQLIWLKSDHHHPTTPFLVSLNNARSSIFQIESFENATLVCEPIADSGNVRVLLRSVIEIKNKLPVQLEIIYVSKDTKLNRATLKPGDSHGVPLVHVNDTSTIQLKLLLPNDEFYIGEKIPMPTLLEGTSQEMVMQGAEPCAKYHCYVLQTSRNLDKAVLEVYSPVYIENLLPFDSSVTLNFNENFCTAVKIGSGETLPVQLYGISSVDSLSLDMSIDAINAKNVMPLQVRTVAELTLQMAGLTSNSNFDVRVSIEPVMLGHANKWLPIRIRFYVDYWLIDASGLDLAFSGKISKFSNSASIRGEESISLMSSNSLVRTKGCKLQVNVGVEPSSLFDVSTIGMKGSLEVPAESNSVHHLAVSIYPGPSSFARTIAVRYSPRFLIQNYMNQDLWIRQYAPISSNTIPQCSKSIESDSEMPFSLLCSTYPSCIQVQLGSELRAHAWSGKISLESTGEFLLKLPADNGMYIVASVVQQYHDGGVITSIRQRSDTEAPKFILKNNCALYNVVAHQAYCESSYPEEVGPLKSAEILLTEPCGPQVLRLQIRDSQLFGKHPTMMFPIRAMMNCTISLKKAKKYPSIFVNGIDVWVSVEIEGLTTIIIISDCASGVHGEMEISQHALVESACTDLREMLSIENLHVGQYDNSSRTVRILEACNLALLWKAGIDGRGAVEWKNTTMSLAVLEVCFADKTQDMVAGSHSTEVLWVPQDDVPFVWKATSTLKIRIKVKVKNDVFYSPEWLVIAIDTSLVEAWEASAEPIFEWYYHESGAAIRLHFCSSKHEDSAFRDRAMDMLQTYEACNIAAAPAGAAISDIAADTKSLMVTVLSAYDLQHEYQKADVYCAITYVGSTLITDAVEVFHRSNERSAPQEISIRFKTGCLLGLEFSNEPSDQILVSSVCRESPHGTDYAHLVGKRVIRVNEINVQDISGKEILQLIEQAKKEQLKEHFTLNFDVGSLQDKNMEAEFNHSLSFHVASVEDRESDEYFFVQLCSKQPHVQEYSVSQEAAVVPMLNFLGKDYEMANMSHLSHTKRDDVLGEALIRIPFNSFQQKGAADSLEAHSVLYSPKGDIEIAKIHLAFQWSLISTAIKTDDIANFVQLSIAGIGLSFVGTSNGHVSELLYASITSKNEDDEDVTDSKFGLIVDYANCTNQKHLFNIVADHIQVDNQLHATNYPVLFRPLYQSGLDAPSLQILTILCTSTSTTVFEYTLVELEEWDIQLDDMLLHEMLEFLLNVQSQKPKDLMDCDRSSAVELLNRQSESFASLNSTSASEKFVVGWMLIAPLQCQLTFSSSATQSPLLDILLSDKAGSVVRTIGSAVTNLVSNLNKAPIRCPEFCVENMADTLPILLEHIQQHYVGYGLRSLYKLIGSFDFLGNPAGFVSSVKTGVEDFFSTPAQLLLENENSLRIENLRAGISKGSKSLVKNTTMGIFHTTGKLTEALGKGVSMLAMDATYNEKRQQRYLKQDASIQNVGDGILVGGKRFAGGVYDGLKGVVVNPVQGAEAEGANGFIIGLGKGFAGLVVKPTTGLLDLLTSVSRGVHRSANAIDSIENSIASRRRLPRRICSDNVVACYSARESKGLALLALNRILQSDTYIYHIYNSDEISCALLATNKRIVCMNISKSVNDWELQNDESLQIKHDSLQVILSSKESQESFVFNCLTEVDASRLVVSVETSKVDLLDARYFLLNLDASDEQQVTTDDSLSRFRASSSVRRCSGIVANLTVQDLQNQSIFTANVSHLKSNMGQSSTRWTDSFLPFSTYKVVVCGGPYEWICYRRFSEFRSMVDQLEKLDLIDLSKLPPFPNRYFVRGTKSAVVAHRQRLLTAFLNEGILRDPQLRQSPIVIYFLTHQAVEIQVCVTKR